MFNTRTKTEHAAREGARRGARRGAAQPKRQSLTAAAEIVTGAQLRQMLGHWTWQKSAWDFYDTCGELHYGISYLAQAASRARLYIGLPDPNGAADPTPIDDPQAQALLDELGTDFTGHADMIRKMCIHLGVPGESFLIGIDDPDEGRKWITASQDELQSVGNDVWLRTSPNTRVQLKDDSSVIMRVYFQNARFSWEPESHVRALLPDLARLQALNSHLLATTDSRLAGAGVLFIGDSVSPPAGNPGDEVEHEDPFVDGLMKAMITPISDRNSASSVVPFVVRVPDESIDKIKLVTFYTPFDKAIPELIELTLKKIAIGLNIPPEVLLGLGDTNHWSAWAIDENVVKISVAPLLSIICQTLTGKYLRPSYQKLTNKPCEAVIWFDTTELTQRPQKSAEANTLHDKGLISDEATRRENGFSEEDAPSHEERLRNTLWALANNPQSAALVLPTLGVKLPEIAPPAPPAIHAEQTDDPADDDGAEPARAGGARAIPGQPDRAARPPAELPPGPSSGKG